MMDAMAHQPLAGMRVLDVTTSIAGPYCAQMLAALGADVSRSSAPTRATTGAPGARRSGTARARCSSRRTRASARSRSRCAIARGREALLRLADGADVFLQSLRPGLADELGLGPDALRARNPRLVYCSVGAYGRVGPLAREPGYDALMQAAGGLISITGEPGRPGVRVGSSLIDQGTGTWAALGVLAALLERERTGEGSVVDVSLYETALGVHRLPPRGVPGGRHRPARAGHAVPDGRAVPGLPHARRRADDRRRQRPALRRRSATCSACPELVDDPRFATNPTASRTGTSSYALARGRGCGRTTPRAGTSGSRAAGVPAAPVADVRDVPSRRRRRRSGSCSRLDHPRIEGLTLTALPLSLDGERALHRSAPPDVGAAHHRGPARGRLRRR